MDWFKLILSAGVVFGNLAAQETPAADGTASQPAETGSQPAEYGGPSVLSRSGLFSPGASREPVSFRPYIGASGIYASGLAGITDQNGHFITGTSFGILANAGLYGTYVAKRWMIKLDYRGDYRRYSNLPSLDGTDQYLTLSLARQMSRRWTFILNEMAGTTKQNWGGLGYSYYYDPTLLSAPVSTIFDNRINYYQTSGALKYNESARLSFTFGGSGSVIRQQSSALFGVTGYTALADMSYRTSKTTTLAVDYSFSHYEFLRSFGAFDAHSIAADYSVQLTRNLQFGARGGVYRMESLILEQVAVNPIIAAITGQTTGIAAAYSINYFPLIGARLAYQLKRTSATLTYTDSISGGNGLYLAGRMSTISGSITSTGARHWHLSADAGYDSLSGSFQAGKYQDYFVGGGVTRDVARDVHSVLRLDVRKFKLSAGVPFPLQVTVSLGFDYSPGDIPLRLW